MSSDSATAALPSAPDASCSPLARARIRICYAWRHRRLPNLDDPRLFTELIQHRKLCSRTPRFAAMTDKLAAKQIATAALGPEWIVPTLWQGTTLPPSIPFPVPAILKARHGCNQYAALDRTPSSAYWRWLRWRGRSWQRRAYGRWLDEAAYQNVPRGLLAEPLLGGALPLPIDYKIYVFRGQATHVQVHLDRAKRHRWILHDRNWRQLVQQTETPTRPASLAAMLDAAEILAVGLDFLRIDFYEITGRPYFGEFCVYPGSGLDRFAAEWIDVELGRLWRSAG